MSSDELRAENARIRAELDGLRQRLEAIRHWAHGSYGGVKTPAEVWPALAALVADSPEPEPEAKPQYVPRCGVVEPGCEQFGWAMEYDPACCRFPKSCSADVCTLPREHAGDHRDEPTGRSWSGPSLVQPEEQQR